MPPSRTQGAAVPEPQQCFTSTVVRLKALAKVNSLQGFANAVFWAEQIGSTPAAVANACTIDNGEDVGSYNKLLEAFHLAISNGQKQLALNWPQSNSPAVAPATCDPTFHDAVATFALLSRALSSCRHLEWYQHEHVSRELDSAMEAGFLQNFTSLISKLLPAVQGTAAQHAARHDLLVAMYLLQLWCYVFESWPGCKLTDSSLTATIEPAARLAFALMRAIPADVTPANSGNNSKTSNTSKAHVNETVHFNGDMRLAPCYTSVCFAYRLLCAVHKKCIAPNRSSNQSIFCSTAAAVLASADVQRLLLFGLAAAAAVMHRQQEAGSTSPAAPAAPTATGVCHTLQPGQRQQQHVDYGYVQLLTAMEIPGADQLMSSVLEQGGTGIEDVFKDPGFHQCIFRVVVHLYNSLSHQQQNHSSSSASSSNNTATSPQCSPDIQALLQQLALPVLHTLKDFALLLPDDDGEGVGVVIYVFGSVARPLMQLNRLGLQELQQVLQWLLQPLYQKMCKAVRTFSRKQQTAKDSGSADPECAPTQTWALAVQMFLAVSGLSVQDTCEAIKQDVVTSVAAVEALARIRSRCITSQQQPLIHPVYRMSISVLTALMDDSDSEDVLACPAVQLQLLSLILCQLKLLMLVSAAPWTTSAIGNDIPASEILSVDLQKISRMLCMLLVVDHQPIYIHQPQPDGITEATLHAWLVVMGKAMYATAVNLLKQMPAPQLMVCLDTEVWAYLARHGLELSLLAIDDHGKAALVTAEVTALLEQLLGSITTPVSASTADGEGDESSRAVLHLMQQCGSAICAALPVKFCYNNPACVNLDKLSEQQLVAGKGSRCSGCKVARYCSRECQVKHWKQHKQACKRIQAEAAVVEGSS